MTIWKRAMAPIVGAVSLFALALAPTPAQAADYCVHAAADPCTGQVDKGLNLSGALADAAASPEDDTIFLRPGTYIGTSVSPFNYLGTASSGKLRLVGSGAGPGGTVLARDPGNIVITMILQGPGDISVENLAVEVPNGSTAGQNEGLRLVGFAPTDATDHVIDGVAVILPPVPTVGSGPLAGVHLQNATFRKGTVTGPLPTSFAMTGVASSGADVIEDSTITAKTAISMGGGGRASRVDATASTGFDIASNTGTGFYTVEDVLWRPPTGQSGSGIVAACGAQSVNVTVRNVTFALTPALGVASLVGCPSGTGRLDIQSSIFDGGNKAIVIGNGSNVSAAVSYSNFDAAKIQSADPSDVQQGAGNLNEVPDFVGGGDFRLKSTSKLLDKGDPAALAAGESATDLGGQPRVVDVFPLLCSPSPPRRDMGAYEFQPPTPPPGSCGGPTPPSPSPQPGPAPGPTPPILGTPGPDVLYGTPGDDVINGLGGNDVIFGLAGNDVIYGLDGNDVIFGNEGKDRLFGGLGSDYLHGGQKPDRCRGGPGTNILRSC